MKVIELLNLIKGEIDITFYEYEDNKNPLCHTRNTWGGVVPYYQREVFQIEISADLRTCVNEVIIRFADKEEKDNG